MTFAFLHFLSCLDFRSGIIPAILRILGPDVLLSAPELGSIDGDEECLRASALEVLYVLPGELAILIDVPAVGRGLGQVRLRKQTEMLTAERR